MVATAAIPVVNVFVKSVTASTVLAFLAALAAGFSQLWRHREHWERYRATASALESLLIRYELRLPPYDGDDAPARVIAEADRLLGEEEAKWTAAIRAAKPQRNRRRRRRREMRARPRGRVVPATPPPAPSCGTAAPSRPRPEASAARRNRRGDRVRGRRRGLARSSRSSSAFACVRARRICATGAPARRIPNRRERRPARRTPPTR